MDESAPQRNTARNLELKVRCDAADLDKIRARLFAAGVTTVRMRQIDTYFAVPRGRLKLREIVGPGEERAAELIGYTRLDVAAARWSAYDLVPVSPGDAPALKRALAATVGVRVVVVKERDVGVLRRTRVHLDEVKGHGCFVELETVVAPGDEDATASDELVELAALLGLDGLETVAGSYADLAG